MSTVSAYTGILEPSETIAGWICELASKAILKVPASGPTRQLLATWLAHGEDAAQAQARDINGDSEADQRLAQIRSEHLLAPLLAVS